MLSVSKLLGKDPGLLIEKDTGSTRYSRDSRPVVVWNMTKRCGLRCVHCYIDSEDKAYPGELTTAESMRLIDDLAAFGVPAVILSGGDPLLRGDLFEIAGYCKEKKIRTALSTNGIAIDSAVAKKIKDSGILYVGVSLDGGAEINDRLRGLKGGFEKALNGLRLCRDMGLIVGVRFTMSKKTVGELPFIFDLIEKEGVHRGYFSHLVYAGRGGRFSREDLSRDETRGAVDYIFDKAQDFIKRGIKKDIVTGSNDADGVYLYLKLKEEDVESARAVYELLLKRGGNSSGVTLGNIDSLGNVHPDQFWQGYTFGNVKERSFGEIWMDTSDPLLKALKDRKGLVKGRCSGCRYFDICGGSYRVRAQFVFGDIWAEDPGCYITDDELRR